MCARIHDDFNGTDLNALSAWSLGNTLKARLRRLETGGADGSVDVLVTGCEVSTGLGEQFARRVRISGALTSAPTPTVTLIPAPTQPIPNLNPAPTPYPSPLPLGEPVPNLNPTPTPYPSPPPLGEPVPNLNPTPAPTPRPHP